MKERKSSIPLINFIVKKYLCHYKNRILKMPFTPERSSVVDCVDNLLEAGEEGNHDRQ
jgi:hypothetical protein